LFLRRAGSRSLTPKGDRSLPEGSAMVRIVRIAALCAAMVAAGTAFADNYPNRIVRIIVPFPAGGPTDVMARFIGQKLSERLGQPYTTSNPPGDARHNSAGNA